jgi:ATP-dependent exoDNAse (exonuclease V) beta subunit
MAESGLNYHHRDDKLKYVDETHTYTVDDQVYISVTTLVHAYFPKFDPDVAVKNIRNRDEPPYQGLTDDQIKEMWHNEGQTAAKQGTAMHLNIENTLLGIPVQDTSTEYKYFLKFRSDYPNLTPYRLEWRVWHECGLAGSIDAVFKEGDQYHIYDWKRSKNIKTFNRYSSGLHPIKNLDDCNYYHYALQLNIYKWILEQKYDIFISTLAIVVLHPNNNGYVIHYMPNLQTEVNNIIAHYTKQQK